MLKLANLKSNLSVEVKCSKEKKSSPSANATEYPEHDHSGDGMEEVYTALEGKAILVVGGEEYELEPGTFARVGAGETRKLITRDEAARVLAIGAVPGEIYEPPEFTEEGQPDPMAG